jgi:hypothetical protein
MARRLWQIIGVTVVGGSAVLAVGLVTACSRDVQAYSPQQLQQRYGIADAYTGQVTTTDGTLRGTLVPVTLPDGRRAELIIPDRRQAEPHTAYFRDEQGLHPIELQESVTRDQIVSSPAVVTRRAERPHARHRSWEKEVLIIGGSAGAGAGIGALTGGKKGAGIGAAAGGLGGLIYDLATRNKK